MGSAGPRIIRIGVIPLRVRVSPRTGTPQRARQIRGGMPKVQAKVRARGVVIQGGKGDGIAEAGKTRAGIVGKRCPQNHGKRIHISRLSDGMFTARVKVRVRELEATAGEGDGTAEEERIRIGMMGKRFRQNRGERAHSSLISDGILKTRAKVRIRAKLKAAVTVGGEGDGTAERETRVGIKGD